MFGPRLRIQGPVPVASAFEAFSHMVANTLPRQAFCCVKIYSIANLVTKQPLTICQRYTALARLLSARLASLASSSTTPVASPEAMAEVLKIVADPGSLFRRNLIRSTQPRWMRRPRSSLTPASLSLYALGSTRGFIVHALFVRHVTERGFLFANK